MAVTNAQIIADYKAAHGMSPDTPLYTYAVWLKKGYRVKRGEGCHHRVQMWKHKDYKSKPVTEPLEGSQEKKSNEGYCFTKTMNLFEASQVERIEG